MTRDRLHEAPALQLDFLLRSPRILVPQDPAAAVTTIAVVALGQCAIATQMTPRPDDDARALYDCIQARVTGIQAFLIRDDPCASSIAVGSGSGAAAGVKVVAGDTSGFVDDEPARLLQRVDVDVDIFLSKVVAPTRKLAGHLIKAIDEGTTPPSAAQLLEDQPPVTLAERIPNVRVHCRLHRVHLLFTSAKYHGLMAFAEDIGDAASAFGNNSSTAAASSGDAPPPPPAPSTAEAQPADAAASASADDTTSTSEAERSEAERVMSPAAVSALAAALPRMGGTLVKVQVEELRLTLALSQRYVAHLETLAAQQPAQPDLVSPLPPEDILVGSHRRSKGSRSRHSRRRSSVAGSHAHHKPRGVRSRRASVSGITSAHTHRHGMSKSKCRHAHAYHHDRSSYRLVVSAPQLEPQQVRQALGCPQRFGHAPSVDSAPVTHV